jgi:hypothetical protein
MNLAVSQYPQTPICSVWFAQNPISFLLQYPIYCIIPDTTNLPSLHRLTGKHHALVTPTVDNVRLSSTRLPTSNHFALSMPLPPFQRRCIALKRRLYFEYHQWPSLQQSSITSSPSTRSRSSTAPTGSLPSRQSSRHGFTFYSCRYTPCHVVESRYQKSKPHVLVVASHNPCDMMPHTAFCFL